MTTIAYKDGVIAGDCMSNLGYANSRRHSKVWRDNKTGSVFGGCGSSSELVLMRDWFKAGRDKEKKPKIGTDHGTMLIEVCRDGKVWAYDWNLVPMDVADEFCAVGSGGSFALGAMAAGKSAVQAVKIAMRYDKHTGFGVRHLKVKP